MPILFNRFYKEQATSAGGLTINTSKMQGFLKHLIVQAATSSTIFDFSITDGSSLQLLQRESVDGEINESLEIPVQSNLVLTVTSATRDENFKIYLAVQEE